MGPNKRCRCCAVTVEERHLKLATEQFLKFQELYSALARSKVHEDDDLPKLVCTACVIIFELIANFNRTCSQSIDFLRELINDNNEVNPMDVVVPTELLLQSENDPNSRKPFIQIKEHQRQQSLLIANEVESSKRALLKDERPSTQEAEIQIDHSYAEKKTENRPMCALCGKTFLNLSSIRCHMLLELKKIKEKELHDKYGIKPPVCRKEQCSFEGCKRVFKKKDRLFIHLKEHEGFKVAIKCMKCKRTFRDLTKLRRHEELQHNDNAEPRPILECSTCFRNFKSDQKLTIHILKMHCESTDTFECEICGARHLTEVALQKHKTNYHKAQVVPNYSCHHCGRTHTSKKLLKSHIKNIHMGPVYETCFLCGVRTLKSQMRYHQREKHSTGEPTEFPCKVCNKVFKKMELLNRHIKIHSAPRTHVCQVCGMAFLWMQSLKKHLYRHTGERPVQCEVCGKGVYTKRALEIHMNTHNRKLIAEGQTGIKLLVYATSNKGKNGEKQYANANTG